jgi:hypothetical protein
MQTKIKATVYAAKLRKRLAELKKQRPVDLAAHKTAVEAWRKALTLWILHNAKARVDAITAKQITDHSARAPRWHLDAERVLMPSFDGAPEPPVYPDDRQIRDITAMLRHLGITGQETILVSTEDVTKYLGEGSED